VVADGMVWVTTAGEVPCTPEQAKERLKTNTGDQPLTLRAEVRLHAQAVDASTGRLVHDVELLVVKDPQWVHQQNSYASPTPVLADGKLYAHFGAFGTACLDTETGAVLWRNQEIQLMHENGPGSSPVVWRDKVIFHADGSDTQRIVALDAATGKLAWETKRSGTLHENPQLQKSYATPIVLERDGQPVLFSNGADWIYGYDPATGRELWRRAYGELGFSLSARPVETQGLVVFSTGFMKPVLQAVRCGVAGEPELAWTVTKNAPTIPSPLAVGGEVFFLADQSMASCVDARTGEEHYRERLGGNFNASPVAADGRIYATSREGVTHVLAAGPEFRKLAENRLDGQQWATMAAVDGAFFIRTDTALYRISAPHP
jgi:outer membrane protein assembly factor BamB